MPSDRAGRRFGVPGLVVPGVVVVAVSHGLTADAIGSVDSSAFSFATWSSHSGERSVRR